MAKCLIQDRHTGIPYAWQPQGQTIELPTAKGKRLNVLGFFTLDNELTPFCVEGGVDTQTVIGCFDAVSETVTKKTVVVIDNGRIAGAHGSGPSVPVPDLPAGGPGVAGCHRERPSQE